MMNKVYVSDEMTSFYCKLLISNFIDGKPIDEITPDKLSSLNI